MQAFDKWVFMPKYFEHIVLFDPHKFTLSKAYNLFLSFV